MGLKDKIMNMARQHTDKVDQGVDKLSETAKQRFGHEEQVDKVAEKGKGYVRDDKQDPGQQEPGPPPQQ